MTSSAATGSETSTRRSAHDGVAFVPFSAATKTFNSLAVDRSGRIVISGTATENFEDDFTLARFNADGVLDVSFDSDGLTTVDFGGIADDFATSLEIGIDGKLYIVGYTRSSNVNQAAIVRLNVDGSLDNTFDGDGRLVTTLSTETDQRTLGSALTPDGSLLVLGGNRSDIQIARIHSGVIPFVGSDSVDVTDNEGTLLFDYGDAPSSVQSGFAGTYPVTSGASGASHNVTVGGPILGFLAEAESSGVNSAGAIFDDGNGSDDEDGVVFRDVIVASGVATETGSVIVELQNANSIANYPGRLDRLQSRW